MNVIARCEFPHTVVGYCEVVNLRLDLRWMFVRITCVKGDMFGVVVCLGHLIENHAIYRLNLNIINQFKSIAILILNPNM